MRRVNHKELQELVKHYYANKISLFVWGRFGIGKSEVIRKTSQELAKERKREYVEWNKLNEQEKERVFENPDKYFVLIDIRLSEYDSSDIKGLPNFKGDKKSIEFRVPYWALFMEKEESDGILFMDELNLGTPLVISSCYKIIYDRIINESKMSDHWLTIGAGNLSEDRSYTHDLAPPLRDRGGEVELLSASAESWTEWAINNGIDGRIVGYINFKQSNIWSVNFEDNQKFTTPRGWCRVSHLIKDVKEYPKMELITSSAIGEGIASEFVGFCKIQEDINLDELIKNPKKIKDIPNNEESVGIKYFIASAVAERYRENKLDFKKVLEISEELDKQKNPAFVALMWRMCYGYKKQFKTEFINEVSREMAERYARYLT